MFSAFSRRNLLSGLVGSAVVWKTGRVGMAGQGSTRKFTMDLVCGNLGVRAAAGSHRPCTPVWIRIGRAGCWILEVPFRQPAF